ncbi:PREDICTED: inactive pancreatic lipase-related protein 1-like [Acropora digitifera]|uniref:inactive pancreatic lipase-related protein 1-like n=1 Tax=Acropora digitifera TaxID=70779 RepID=UPI00077AC1D5|nr:PREDICTED: inactive pancreatic lipase-related protein 1-like [Acropora digitifera]
MAFTGATFVVFFAVTALTQGFLWPKKVCYESYGCFKQTFGLFQKLPQSPAEIGTTFHLFTRQNKQTAQNLDDATEGTLKASNFRNSRRTIFVVHGFLENINNRWVKPMKDALLEKENCNVILVDWSKGASNPFNYLQAAGNTRLVGRQISVLIKFLISYGNNGPGSADSFYIVGFSLGAQTAGYAGSYLKARYNLMLDRITGLDPAGLGFNLVTDDFRLDKSDATFVDIIHTDADLVGTFRAVGDADFYPNGGKDQPGCRAEKGIVGKIACDHMRAPTYYIASVKGPCTWRAYPCNSYQLFQQGKCKQCTRRCSAMGYNANPRMTGKFYLKTNSQEPFCDIPFVKK